MEPVDYLGALRRSWRLIVALAPHWCPDRSPGSRGGAHHGKKHVKKLPNPWSAQATVGAAPTGINSLVGGGATGSQIQFYASSTAVMRDTVNASGLRTVKTANLGSYLKATLLIPKGAGKRQAQDANEVVLNAKGKTAHQARTLANDYAEQVGIYLNRIASARVRATSAGAGHAGSGYVIVHPALAAKESLPKRPGAGPVKSRKIRALIGLGVGCCWPRCRCCCVSC